MKTARLTARIATWILLIASLVYTHQLRNSNTQLMDSLESANKETEIVGMAMMKLKDQTEGFEEERLALAKAILEPEGFMFLNPNTTEVTFENFNGSLQWFTTPEPQKIGSRQALWFNQLHGPNAPGVTIRSDNGITRLAVPTGAYGYLTKGMGEEKGYQVRHFPE